MLKPAYAVTLLSLLVATACDKTTDTQTAETTDTTSTKKSTVVAAPDWAKNATIYEVNVRQFSPEGNLKAVEAQLPRLKELGADIIWLMPIYPISQERKKGSLGSPYAVANYSAVNPAYGTVADLKSLVARAHALGLRVVLDWVANHTGWDHPWLKQHPDWYTQRKGKPTSPLKENGEPIGWDDVADLDYSKPELRKAMIQALEFWVREANIDGYRCDVAGMVPTDFWAEVHPALTKIKPVFMLAEDENEPKLFEVCFNMNYGWGMHHVLKNVAKGIQPATAIDSLVDRNRAKFPRGYYQMLFTQNHDENTWNGTLRESFGEGAEAFVVLTHTLEGMPLLYNGLESGLDKRLAFFEKDTIAWGDHPRTPFYNALLTLKHRNRALWNGPAGGAVQKIPTGNDAKLYAFHRQHENDRVLVIANLSGQPQTANLEGTGYEGTYTDVFNRQAVEIKPGLAVPLKPWEYRVLTN